LFSVLHIESDIRAVQEIVGKIFFDDIALVTTANNKVVNAVCRIGFKNVLEYGFTADVYHRFGTR